MHLQLFVYVLKKTIGPPFLSTRCTVSIITASPPTSSPTSSYHHHPLQQTYEELLAEHALGQSTPIRSINWNILSQADERFAVYMAGTPSARYREFLQAFDAEGPLPPPVPQPPVDDNMLLLCEQRTKRREKRQAARGGNSSSGED